MQPAGNICLPYLYIMWHIWISQVELLVSRIWTGNTILPKIMLHHQSGCPFHFPVRLFCKQIAPMLCWKWWLEVIFIKSLVMMKGRVIMNVIDGVKRRSSRLLWKPTHTPAPTHKRYIETDKALSSYKSACWQGIHGSNKCNIFT